MNTGKNISGNPIKSGRGAGPGLTLTGTPAKPDQAVFSFRPSPSPLKSSRCPARSSLPSILPLFRQSGKMTMKRKKTAAFDNKFL
jgi:hypothetical protein